MVAAKCNVIYYPYPSPRAAVEHCCSGPLLKLGRNERRINEMKIKKKKTIEEKPKKNIHKKK